MSADAPPVSWKAIEKNAVVISSDGQEAGKVSEVAGDPNADIFHGLVISLGAVGANRYLPAERVRVIWPDRVEVDVRAAEMEALSEYEEPVAERWRSPDDFVTRLRRFLRR